jgi:hypothetical protein
LASPLLEYIDEYASRSEHGEIILTCDCVLRLFLVRGGNVINVVQLNDVVNPHFSR